MHAKLTVGRCVYFGCCHWLLLQIEKGGMIDYTYYCDVCDKGCKNEELFNRHMSEHQKCSVPDCNYVAVPKLIKLHYDMVRRGKVTHQYQQHKVKFSVWRSVGNLKVLLSKGQCNSFFKAWSTAFLEGWRIEFLMCTQYMFVENWAKKITVELLSQ